MSRKKRKLKALRTKEQQGKGQQSARKLTQGLIFSGALNIALATSLIFYVVKNKESSTETSFKTSSESALVLDLSREVSLQNTLERYLDLDFESLMTLLKQKETIEEGFTQRDLALSAIAFKYDLDVQRALLGQTINLKTLSLDQKEESVPLYCDLTDAHYRLIHSFLKTEQWPFTSEGLFNRLVQGQNEESLKNAFFLTKEFMLLEALYCPVAVSKEELLELMKQGPWDMVQQFVSSKPQVQHFSNALRIQFLCQYLDFASEKAANLILKTDPDYTLKKLSDEKIVALLGLLENKSELTQNFVLHLALGFRSSWVKQEACRLLYHYAGKEFKNPFNYEEALHFIAQEFELTPAPVLEAFPPQTIEETSAQPVLIEDTIAIPVNLSKTYTVQKGDCLSKIARKHEVEIKALKAANCLEDDLIKVGMTLTIP